MPNEAPNPSFNLSDLTKAYQHYVGQHPVRDTLALAGAAGIGTYAVSRPLLNMLARTTALGGGPALQQSAQGYIQGDSRKASRRLAVLAAAAGATYGILKHSGLLSGNTAPTWPTFDRNNSQGRSSLQHEKAVHSMLSMEPMPQKHAGARMATRFIPKQRAVNYIVTDPVLFESNRAKIAGIVQNSSPGPFTTPARIGATAIKAGAGFGAGYVLGKGMGTMLSMPEPLVDRLSRAGGIAAAVLGSGVLKQI